MFQSGQQIGSYTLISKLGKGGFGEVWLAEKRSELVTKKVAIKLPLEDQVNLDAIRQEAELWEQASGHANVLPIIDADVINGQVVIVSEYADGGSLHDILKRDGKFKVQKAIEMTIGILNGLEFLHNRKIIHRDIKPQNILLQGETPRLADFGISRAMQTTAVSSTIIGTDAYMSPESFEGKRSVQTDIWSVGVVLYQFLTGNLPFPQEHPSERMFAILQRDFEPLPNEIPPVLQNILRKALAKLPENRYASASEMREDLKRSLAISEQTVKFGQEQFPTPILQDEQETIISVKVQIPLDETMPSPIIQEKTITASPFVSPKFESKYNEQVVDKTENLDLDESQKAENQTIKIAIGIAAFLILILVIVVFFDLLGNRQNEISKVSNIFINKPNSNISNRNTNVNSSANTAINSNLTENLSNKISTNSNVIANDSTIETPKPTPDKAQLQQVMNKYIAGVAKVSGNIENKSNRKTVLGDIDGDGDSDAVTEFTLEASGGGNGWNTCIAVFRNNEGEFEGVTDDYVGGKFWRSFYLKSVVKNKITGLIEICKYADDDLRPCFQGDKPYIKKTINILFSNNKLSVPE